MITPGTEEFPRPGTFTAKNRDSPGQAYLGPLPLCMDTPGGREVNELSG